MSRCRESSGAGLKGWDEFSFVGHSKAHVLHVKMKRIRFHDTFQKVEGNSDHEPKALGVKQTFFKFTLFLVWFDS